MQAAFGDDGPEDPHGIKAVMLIKAQILRRQKGVLDVLRQGGQGDHRAVLTALEGRDLLIVAVIDRAGLLNGGDLGKIQLLPGGHVKQEPARRQSAQGQDGQGQRQPAEDMPFRPSLQAPQGPPVLPLHPFFHLFHMPAHPASPSCG